MSPVKGYTPEEQHLSRLENDLQYLNEWKEKHAVQRSQPTYSHLMDTSTEAETPRSGKYWEGQNGTPSFLLNFVFGLVWLVSFGILVSAFDIGFIVPYFFLSFIVALIVRYKTSQWIERM